MKIAVLVSGRGSNLQSIIDSIEEKKINATIVAVISNINKAPALEKAKYHGIKTFFVDPGVFRTKEDYDNNLIKILKEEQVNLICLAGFMRILSNHIIQLFKNCIMNIHPSLLPSFPGLDAQKKALAYGAKLSGCTVHFVDEGVDSGPIIIQAAVPILENDTVETLSERILKEEHRIYPEAIKAFVEGKLLLRGRKVFWENE